MVRIKKERLEYQVRWKYKHRYSRDFYIYRCKRRLTAQRKYDKLLLNKDLEYVLLESRPMYDWNVEMSTFDNPEPKVTMTQVLEQIESDSKELDTLMEYWLIA